MRVKASANTYCEYDDDLINVGGDQKHRNVQHQKNVVMAREQGKIAKAKGQPVWMNPYFGKRGASWKAGWDEG